MRYYFAVVGVLMLVAAVGLFLRRAALALHGVAAQGWVEDFDARTSRDGTTYFPVVAFVDEAGHRRRFTAAAGRQARRPDVGTLVTVRYSRDNPDAACIQSFLHMWAAPLALALLGSGALLGFFKAAR